MCKDGVAGLTPRLGERSVALCRRRKEDPLDPGEQTRRPLTPPTRVADLFCFPFFSEIAHIYKSNKQKFEATARDWTSKYAM